MQKDKELFLLLEKEKQRQKKQINLIASENIVSDAVRKALASYAGNKYAEGYPGKRYYAGNTIIDEIEKLAQKRALELFNLSKEKWGVNVQALSGSPANFAVYHALLPKKGKIMGLELSHGGHLTHGSSVSFSGSYWKAISYFLDKKTERLNYEEIYKKVKKEKPNILIAGYTAYSRKIQWKKFKKIADEVGAIFMVDMSHIAGLIAAKEHPSPFPYADIVSTTTHKTLRGPRAALIFARKDKKKDGKSFFELIQKSVFPGLQGGPHMNTIAGIATALFEANQREFKTYIKQVKKNTETLANELKKRGWRIISGGTDTHLFLVDVWKNGKGIDGKQAAHILEKNGIIVNMNTIPYDSRPPFRPSGIRIGAATETTKGKKEKEMKKIAEKIDKILKKEINKNL